MGCGLREGAGVSLEDLVRQLAELEPLELSIVLGEVMERGNAGSYLAIRHAYYAAADGCDKCAKSPAFALQRNPYEVRCLDHAPANQLRLPVSPLLSDEVRFQP